jgi:hypothetical protein
MPYTVVDKSSLYFNTKLFTGNGSTQSITGVGFSPDWVWTKNRSAAESHELYDTVRGATKRIMSHSTAAENIETYFASFDSDGFTFSGNGNSNANGNNIVAWCWDANGTGVSNTAGSISSTVSANTTSGFSIVSYTGNRTPTADQSIGHGLGAVPTMMIVKNRSNGTRGWRVYHKSLGTPDKELILNSTAGVGTDTATWGNTTPTSSVFYVGASGETNTAGENYIAYCFAEVKGYSKAFSYTGNGNADGTFVYTGFKPAFLIIKRTDSADNWMLFDNKRDPYNLSYHRLSAESSAVEDTNIGSIRQNIDLLSNGFKCRQPADGTNASGGTYIGIAFAENPFVSSKGIPTTAR